MKEIGVWKHPVILPELEPPRTEIVGDWVCRPADTSAELLRCLSNSPGIILPDRIGELQVTVIGAGAMSNCTLLTCAILPAHLRRIGDYAFYHCDALTDVNIPGSVQRIGDRAFAWCRSLRSLYVPPTVLSLGENVFEGVEDLILTGEEGSAIHRYAEENGMFFMAAGGPHAA